MVYALGPRVVQGLQSFLLKIDITETIVHKTDKPNTLIDLPDADGLAGKAISPTRSLLRIPSVHGNLAALGGFIFGE